MNKNREIPRCDGLTPESVKMMTKGFVKTKSGSETVVEVRRGMALYSFEGQEVGKLAAVMVGQGSRQALCLILGHLPKNACYQSLPASWIERVEGEKIYLNERFDRIRSLPDWHFV